MGKGLFGKASKVCYPALLAKRCHSKKLSIIYSQSRTMPFCRRSSSQGLVPTLVLSPNQDQSLLVPDLLTHSPFTPRASNGWKPPPSTVASGCGVPALQALHLFHGSTHHAFFFLLHWIRGAETRLPICGGHNEGLTVLYTWSAELKRSTVWGLGAKERHTDSSINSSCMAS